VGSADVVQAACEEPLSATAEQPAIDTPPISKFTVPVALDVTVAVNVTDAPWTEDVGELSSVVIDVARPTPNDVADDETLL
jgi:hypothetical protein